MCDFLMFCDVGTEQEPEQKLDRSRTGAGPEPPIEPGAKPERSKQEWEPESQDTGTGTEQEQE